MPSLVKPSKSALLSASAIRSAGSGDASAASLPATVAVNAEPVSVTVVAVGSPPEMPAATAAAPPPTIGSEIRLFFSENVMFAAVVEAVVP